MKTYQTDILIIGAGIAGMVAALELCKKGKNVLMIDRQSNTKIGGLARYAFGGMALVGTPEQKRMGIQDSPELALNDWFNVANFSATDHWQKRWAEYYVNNSKQRIYDYVRQLGVTFLPAVNWVERGLFSPGNSVPRYHIMWGTSLKLVTQTEKALTSYLGQNLSILFQHSADELTTEQQQVTGCTGSTMDGDAFQIAAEQTIIATGGFAGNLDAVKRYWPESNQFTPDAASNQPGFNWGPMPSTMLNGSHPTADGHMHHRVESLGGKLTNMQSMWNYAAGIPHPEPEFDNHGLSLIPCKSALWLDAHGDRIGPEPMVTGFDTNYLCQQMSRLDTPWAWQILNWRIGAKEFAISGAEHNPLIRDEKLLKFLWQTLRGNHSLLQQMKQQSDHFLVADTLPDLVRQMNQLTDSQHINEQKLQRTLTDWDQHINRGERYWNDDQLRRIVQARQWKPDRMRTCKPAALLEPANGPLIAIKVHLIARKNLGGIQTNLSSQVLSHNGDVIPGLYAIGEAAGFGGGGISGARSLEGTFLSGCILTARQAADAI